jgi:tRNA 2-thiouridine synthesizing protein A
MEEFVPDHIVDVRGLQCPLPVLKTEKMLDSLSSGEIMKIITTDPATKRDIPALLKRLGDELLKIEEDEDIISFLIRKR